MIRETVEALRRRAAEISLKDINRRKYFGVKVNIQQYVDLIVEHYSGEAIDDIINDYYPQRQSITMRNFKEKIGDPFGDEFKAALILKIMEILEDSYEKGGRRILDRQGNVIMLDKVVNKAALASIQANQLKYLAGLSRDVLAKIHKDLVTGFRLGKSIDEIRKDIQASVKHMTKARANRIARSEVIRASAAGTKQAMTEMGVKYYIWITAQDRDVCPICKKIARRRYVVGDAYSPMPVKDSHPNCRCAIVSAD